jgi:phosphoribosylglycinamide formyltransferase-1
MPKHLAVLGSTNGTDLVAIYDAIASKKLDAVIDIVISNKPTAGILEKAKNWGLNYQYVEPIKNREEYDQKIIAELKKYPIDLILLIGYMRILSPVFVRAFPNRIMNVHPSLLPAFAGGMDANVHEEVLKSGVKETGCTIHFVDESVDGGPIIIQKKCAVEPNETVETLKNKVQKLEGKAFIEAIQNFQTNNLK